MLSDQANEARYVPLADAGNPPRSLRLCPDLQLRFHQDGSACLVERQPRRVLAEHQ